MGKLNGTNPNHPKKGSSITVDPIRADTDIKKVKRLLNDNTRDLLLFTMGINNGLRISDLLKLKVGDVRDIKPGQTLKVKETKTGKMNILMINKSVHKVLKQYLEEVKSSDEDYLFQSRNGDNKTLTRETVNKMIKEWTKSFNGNYGTHTLRKTFGYIQRTKYGVSFEVLCKRFGHSSPAITMRYLGIDDKEVAGILLNEI
ncbi:tyrosine-type recombinase/integrase [Thermodesulfobacteriota bacterium]